MARQLSPSGYQKIMAAQMRARGAAPRPQTAPKPQAQPQGPSGTDIDLSKAGRLVSASRGLAGLLPRTDGVSVSRGLEAAATALAAANAARSFQRGQTIPGVAQTLGAAGSALRLAPQSLRQTIQQGTGLPSRTLSGGLQSLGSLVGGAYGLSQGAAFPGALQLAGGLGQGAQAIAPALPQLTGVAPATAGAIGTAGAGLGALTGLAGGIYGLTQGDVMSGIQGVLGGVGGLASLAPAGATIAGVPIASTAGGFLGTGLGAGLFGGAGTAAGGAAAGAAGAGAGAGAIGGAGAAGGGAAAGGAAAGGAGAAGAGSTAAASIAGAAGALSIPLIVGFIVSEAVNAGLGEGKYGKTKLPFGRVEQTGSRFSSAENVASQMSKFIGLQGANQLRSAIQKADSPADMLFMSTLGPKLSPHGELQFSHTRYGHGGDWDDATSPTFLEAAIRAARGDPESIKDFISGLVIRSGEGGVTNPDYMLTDWYRRKFVSLLPEDIQQQLGDVNALFETQPEWLSPEAHRQNLWQAARTEIPDPTGAEDFAFGPGAILPYLEGSRSIAGSRDLPTTYLAPFYRDLTPYDKISREIEAQILDPWRAKLGGVSSNPYPADYGNLGM